MLDKEYLKGIKDYVSKCNSERAFINSDKCLEFCHLKMTEFQDTTGIHRLFQIHENYLRTALKTLFPSEMEYIEKKEREPINLVQTKRDMVLNDGKVFYNLKNDAYISRHHAQREDPSLSINFGKEPRERYHLVRYSKNDDEVLEITEEYLVNELHPLQLKQEPEHVVEAGPSASFTDFKHILEVWKQNAQENTSLKNTKRSMAESFVAEQENKTGQKMNESISMGEFFDFNRFGLRPNFGVKFGNSLSYLNFDQSFQPKKNVLKISFFNNGETPLKIEIEYMAVKKGAFYLLDNEPNDIYLEGQDRLAVLLGIWAVLLFWRN